MESGQREKDVRQRWFEQIKRRVRLRSRLNSLMRRGTLRLGVIGLEDVRVIKGDPDDTDNRTLIRQIVDYACSRAASAYSARIERDKAELIKRLADMKADPAPLPSTRYKTEGEAVAGCATPQNGGRLLYGIVRTLRPLGLIEFGAAHGYGALYIGSALSDNGMGRLLTLEGMDVRIKLGRETIHRFHLSHYAEVVPGDFCITVPEAIKRAQPLDMIFSDGDKSVELTRQQFEQSIEAMSRGGFMVFDDIDFNAEIEALWGEFVGHPRVSLCLTFFRRWGLLRVEPIL